MDVQVLAGAVLLAALVLVVVAVLRPDTTEMTSAAKELFSSTPATVPSEEEQPAAQPGQKEMHALTALYEFDEPST